MVDINPLTIVAVVLAFIGLLALLGFLYMIYSFGVRDIGRESQVSQKLKQRESERMALIRRYDERRVVDALPPRRY